LRELAVSGISFEWMLIDAERIGDPVVRAKWRANIVRFREQISLSGGDIPGISLQAIERWGRVQLLPLSHRMTDGTSYDMPTEERLVVATAVASGYIYLTEPRDWNSILVAELAVSLETV
jgi:hypothetical protein